MPVFITLEGLDASGKSTQFQWLTERLRAERRTFVAAREPGGTPLGEELRGLLLGRRHEMTIFSEAFLFAAARAELVKQVIQPALRSGESVVCDRFVDSSLAYQGHGRGLPLEFVEQINEMGTGGVRPHRTILLDIAADEILRRKGEEQSATDRFESLNRGFYERVREGFLELAAREPRRWRVLDGSRPREELQEAIWKLVDEIWPRMDKAHPTT